MKSMPEVIVSNAGKLLGEIVVALQRDGKLSLNSWVCTNATNNANANNQLRKDFELYTERIVNSTKYSASRDKVYKYRRINQTRIA